MQTDALAQIHCLLQIKLGYLQELFNYDPLKYIVTISKQYTKCGWVIGEQLKRLWKELVVA